eukprot:COSAG02_NODE_642_length_19038_cov_10.020856_9_plen_103_part_00
MLWNTPVSMSCHSIGSSSSGWDDTHIGRPSDLKSSHEDRLRLLHENFAAIRVRSGACARAHEATQAALSTHQSVERADVVPPLPLQVSPPVPLIQHARLLSP